MKRVSFAALVTLVLALITAAIGLSLRTASTTVNYPNYSSLENGEQGLRAFYETARRLGVPVERNYKSLAKTAGTKGTLVYVRTSVDGLREEDKKELELYERVAKPGARLLFLMNEFDEALVAVTQPAVGPVRKSESRPGDSKEKPPDKGNRKPEEKKGTKTTAKEREDTLLKHWGVEMRFVDTPRKETAVGRAIDAMNSADFGGRWVTRQWSFLKWDAPWKPTAGSDGRVYMLERGFGSGSVVLMLGLESFTNKTLLTKVDSARIAAALSGPRPLIFDEAHLGVADDDTVAGYARLHHLEWLLLGLVVLAALYVWRSSVSFVPALPEIKGAEVVGREAHTALTSLLSQSIKKPDLPREIIDAWRESFPMLPSSKVHVTDESLEAFSTARDSDAPGRYRAVSHWASRRGPPP